MEMNLQMEIDHQRVELAVLMAGELDIKHLLTL